MNSDGDADKLFKILKGYADLPEYSGMDIPSVNAKSLFGNYPIHIAAGNRGGGNMA